MCRNYPGLSLPHWTCLECSEKLPWEDLQTFQLRRKAKECCIAKVLQARLLGPAASEAAAAALKAVLATESEEKRLAKAAGMLRPFLGLVAMGFDERVKVGNLLEVPVLIHSLRRAMCHGSGKAISDLSFDPSEFAHNEAWMLISSSGRGIQSRSNEFYQYKGWNATWDETLFGVCKTVFGITRKVKLRHADSLRRCMDPVDARCTELELELLENMKRKESWLDRAAAMVLQAHSALARPGSSDQPHSDALLDRVDSSSATADPKAQSAVFSDGSTVHGEAQEVLDIVQLTSSQVLGECVQIPITVAAANLASTAVERGTAAAADASAAAAAAAGGSVLLAGTVVLGVISTLMLLWDLLDLAFGPSFGRLLPAAYAICTTLQSLELLGPLDRFDIAAEPLIEEAELELDVASPASVNVGS